MSDLLLFEYAGKVVMAVAGSDEAPIVINPDAAERMAAALPKIANKARKHATECDVSTMGDLLRSLGWLWVVEDPETHTGYWRRKNRKPKDPPFHGSYETATREAYNTLMASPAIGSGQPRESLGKVN